MNGHQAPPPAANEGAIARYPITQPWLMRLKLLTGRYFSLGLSACDAVISYDGLNSVGVNRFPAAITALVIFVIQWQIGLLIVSGQFGAEGFKQKFMSGTGMIGMIQRATGFASIAFIACFYVADTYTNLLAFQSLPFAIALTMAIAFSLSDELITWITDINQAQYVANESLYHDSQDTHRLQVIYQRSRLKTGQQRATEAGEQDGQNWRPTVDI
jgi:hypothetical protein